MAIVDVLLRSVEEEPDKESIFWTKEERCDAKTCRYIKTNLVPIRFSLKR